MDTSIFGSLLTLCPVDCLQCKCTCVSQLPHEESARRPGHAQISAVETQIVQTNIHTSSLHSTLSHTLLPIYAFAHPNCRASILLLLSKLYLHLYSLLPRHISTCTHCSLIWCWGYISFKFNSLPQFTLDQVFSIISGFPCLIWLRQTTYLFIALSLSVTHIKFC